MLQVSRVDLLETAIIGLDVSRERQGFRVHCPWSTADFGKVFLKPGWWRLDCRGGPVHAEIRLSSNANPLVVIPADGGSARTFLADASGYELSLMISPWPDVYSFEVLRLQRLNFLETLKMMLGAGGRLIQRKRSLTLLLRAARRMMSGQALGLRMGEIAACTSPHQQTIEKSNAESEASRQIVENGIVVSIKQGDRLHQDAIAIVCAAFDRDPGLRLVYSDAIEAGRLVPHPQWDADLATHGAFDDAPFFARLGQTALSIGDAVEKWGEVAIGRISLPLVERSKRHYPLRRTVAAPVPPRLPRVSVIIPTKYRIDLLEKCLTGLIERTSYPEIEVIIVDNGVTNPQFAAVLADARKMLTVKVIKDDGPFNFSRLVNWGVKASSGEIVLLLNDDVEPLEAGWMHRLVFSSMSMEVGAVGARLLYPDGSVQHAGVALGLGGTCAHLWRGTSAEEAADNPYIVFPGSRMAVTGACLAVKRSDFDEVGGFDEVNFPIAYNDIDFCLRLHAKGRRNVYRGDAFLIHHESQSRGADDHSVATQKRMAAEASRFLKRWRSLLTNDPNFSPAYDPRIEIGVVHPATYAPHSAYKEP